MPLVTKSPIGKKSPNLRHCARKSKRKIPQLLITNLPPPVYLDQNVTNDVDLVDDGLGDDA